MSGNKQALDSRQRIWLTVSVSSWVFSMDLQMASCPECLTESHKGRLAGGSLVDQETDWLLFA
jgi:hypothetical protein